jgi:hypothetical protein
MVLQVRHGGKEPVNNRDLKRHRKSLREQRPGAERK